MQRERERERERERFHLKLFVFELFLSDVSREVLQKLRKSIANPFQMVNRW